MSRDTQFASFAKALLEEIGQRSADYAPSPGRYIIGTPEWEAVVQKIIARRAYDFARYIASNIPSHEIRRMDAGLISDRQIVNNIHDMTTWPEEEKK